MKKITIFLFGFSIFGNAFAQLFGPSNYEDCVLRGLNNAKTDLAVISVEENCRNKFPEKKQKSSNQIPGLCIIFWDGLKTVKLSSEPKNWRDTYLKYEVAIHEMPVAHVFVSKNYKENALSQKQMYEQVSLNCR